MGKRGWPQAAHEKCSGTAELGSDSAQQLEWRQPWEGSWQDGGRHVKVVAWVCRARRLRRRGLWGRAQGKPDDGGLEMWAWFSFR